MPILSSRRTGPLLIAALLLVGYARLPAIPQQSSGSAAHRKLSAASSEKLPSGVIALQMVTMQTGWAETTNGIFRTTDGAHSWTAVSPVGFTPAGTVNYPRVDFPSADAAWVLEKAPGGSVGLAHTTDGGQTWTALPLPKLDYAGYFLSFPDANDGVLMAVGGAFMYHMTTAIYATSDGGHIWSQVERTTNSVVNIAPGSLPDVGDKVGLSFWNADGGWVTLSVVQNGVVGLYHTTNGGRTWSQQDLPGPPGVDPTDSVVQFLTPPVTFGGGHGALAVQVEPQSTGGTVSTIVYGTGNGGNTWSPTTTVNTGFSNTAFLRTSTDWWLQNNNTGQLWRTIDGGKSWAAVPATTSAPGGSQFSFVDATHGFAWKMDGALRVWKTTDGGVTWKAP